MWRKASANLLHTARFNIRADKRLACANALWRHASLEDPTPTATRPLHHTASVTFISPYIKAGSVEKIGTSLPPHCIRTRACLVDLDSMSQLFGQLPSGDTG